MEYLRVCNISKASKAYKRYPGKWVRLVEWMTGREWHRRYWVLRDVSFKVAPAQAVGIIGINGAGKSTLLRIITGTTQPTTGSIEVGRHIAALLELGMGFHPDFTGRQNIYRGDRIHGLSTEWIGELIPEIEAFAEIGDYIDQLLRTYSSGMQVRLAFAIATAIRPDILIVDEALSVGDAYFQHKSFKRIREFRVQGTTLLIVSHDRSAIQSLYDRATLPKRGFVIEDGNPEEVMDFYNAIIAEKENTTVEIKRLDDGRAQITSGTGEAQVESIALLNEDNEAVEFINVGQLVRLRVEIRIHANLPELMFGYMINDRLGQPVGQPVFGTNTYHLGVEINHLAQGEKLILVFSFQANIGLGSYSISTALHIADTQLSANYERRDLALIFNVFNLNRPSFVGVN